MLGEETFVRDGKMVAVKRRERGWFIYLLLTNDVIENEVMEGSACLIGNIRIRVHIRVGAETPPRRRRFVRSSKSTLVFGAWLGAEAGLHF